MPLDLFTKLKHHFFAFNEEVPMRHFKNFNQIITMESAFKKDGRNLLPEDLSIIEDASVIFDNEKIYWVGQSKDVPKEYDSVESTDMTGKILTPEVCDSHTHLVFGGDRSFEYSLRLNGADYEEIANAGGGILSTMKNTIEASEEELFNTAVERVERIYSYGIGTIEVKSGYGLTLESERKITNVIHRLKEHFSPRIQILNTFLAAHAVPKNYSSSKEYMEAVVYPLLEEYKDKQVIDFVDIFHEVGYFDEDDTKNLFTLSKKYGFKLKIHADEFNDNKGAVIASKFQASSADHLLCTTEDGIKALAESNTVATLLPGTAFFLGKPLANAKAFLDAGCKVSLASDYNPGSCHCDNLLLVASLSAKNMNFNIAQLWAAITLNAAHSLELKTQGVIKEDMASRFTVFNCPSIDRITYSWGRNFASRV